MLAPLAVTRTTDAGIFFDRKKTTSNFEHVVNVSQLFWQRATDKLNRIVRGRSRGADPDSPGPVHNFAVFPIIYCCAARNPDWCGRFIDKIGGFDRQLVCPNDGTIGI